MPYDNFEHLQYKMLKKKMNQALGKDADKKPSEKKEEAKEESSFVIIKPADVRMETSAERSAQPEVAPIKI